MTSALIDGTASKPRTGIFSLKGRLGRAQYIAYSLGAVVGAFLFMLLASLGLMLSGPFGRLLYITVSMLLYYGFLPIFFTILTIKRAHDFNAGGWMALLLLVPVINLMFCFIPGTRGENAYGGAPRASSTGMRLIAVMLPILLITAFLATEDSRTSYEASTFPVAPPSTSLKPYMP